MPTPYPAVCWLPPYDTLRGGLGPVCGGARTLAFEVTEALLIQKLATYESRRAST